MVQRLSRDASLESFISAIERDGCAVVKDFANLSSIKAANAEVRSYLDASLAQSGSTVGALNGGTATCTKLIGRSQTVREKFFSDALFQSLADHFIGLETEIWYGDEPKVQRSDPLLSISITMSSQPGCKAQKLHRDDKNHHAKHVKAGEYSKGRDMLLGLFVPGCDTTEANGATRIVPGSHLWGDEKPDFGPDGTKGVENAELKVGEAFIMLGSLYHGAGEYSLSNGCRTVHIMFMCSGVHRQEEIPFLSYPIEEVKTYSKLVQDRLGWKQSEPNLGWVDLKSPEFLLEQ
ncbi:phytanoyl-CoA dioxygenase [Colletotrichum chrysophilum]|uniref:Phytanoyl-CoA dioxygenase n=1 Tax=Colletotrichum chrysophilum TaxID=1836956 RepID=A0AAD9ACQ1_9PEZI|nr:phytanoyl-CoA dioxygenase [Colletotrichum chrysophilum]